MASRSRGRQLAIQMLYQQHFSGYDLDRVEELFWKTQEADPETRAFCKELVLGVMEHRDQLDLEIQAYLKNWSLERIAILDRMALQVAFVELLYSREVPTKVVIDEAVTLANMFSGESSATFINGVLHAWATTNRGEEMGSEKNEQEAEPEENQPPPQALNEEPAGN